MIGDRKEDRRTRSISFRLTEGEYQKIETAALMSGENPNDWCRDLAVAQANNGHGFTRNEQLIFHQLAKLRYLFGNYVMLTLDQELNAESWDEVVDRSERYTRQIADELIRRYDPHDPYAGEEREGGGEDGLPAAETYGAAKRPPSDG